MYAAQLNVMYGNCLCWLFDINHVGLRKLENAVPSAGTPILCQHFVVIV